MRVRASAQVRAIEMLKVSMKTTCASESKDQGKDDDKKRNTERKDSAGRVRKMRI